MIRVNLLCKAAPQGTTVLTKNTGFLIGLLSGLIVVGLAAGCWALHLTTVRAGKMAQLTQLQKEQEHLGMIRSQLDQFSRQQDQLNHRISLARSLVANRSRPVQLMNDLIASVPKEPRLWLEEVAQNGASVNIRGTALDVPSVTRFILNLSRRGTFAQVDLDFWERKEGLIRFQLSCSRRPS